MMPAEFGKSCRVGQRDPHWRAFKAE